MALQISSALERRLEHMAEESNRSPQELAETAMEAFVEDYEELVAAVKEADEDFERGDFLSHEEVVAHFKQRFAKS